MTIGIADLVKSRLPAQRQRGFDSDERGVTTIEFGLLALPFFMIIGALLETAVIFLSGQILDTAVHDVGRLIRTGQVKELKITDLTQVRTRICDQLFGLFGDCKGLHIEIQVLSDFSNVKITPPIDLAACTAKASDCGWLASRPEEYAAGQGSNIIVAQVYYKWQTLPGFGGFSLSNLNDGTRLISSSTVFRNEPYS